MKKLVTLSLILIIGVVAAGCKKMQKQPVVAEPTGAVAEMPTGDIVEVATSSMVELPSGAVVGGFQLSTSSIKWHGEKIVGNAHDGTVTIKTGFVAFSASDEFIAGEAIIDMSTIMSDNDMLVTHLKSPDFFDTEVHPTAKIVIKSAVLNDSGTQYDAVADLTIKGITHEIEFPIMIQEDATWKMSIVIDRTLWDLKYDSNKFKELGDKAIRDEITFEVVLDLDGIAG